MRGIALSSLLSWMSRMVTQAAERERELARARSQRLKQAARSLPGESVSRGFAGRGALEGYPSHYTSLLELNIRLPKSKRKHNQIAWPAQKQSFDNPNIRHILQTLWFLMCTWFQFWTDNNRVAVQNEITSPVFVNTLWERRGNPSGGISEWRHVSQFKSKSAIMSYLALI